MFHIRKLNAHNISDGLTRAGEFGADFFGKGSAELEVEGVVAGVSAANATQKTPVGVDVTLEGEDRQRAN